MYTGPRWKLYANRHNGIRSLRTCKWKTINRPHLGLGTSVTRHSENRVWQRLELYHFRYYFLKIKRKEHIISPFIAQYYDAAKVSK